MATSMRPGFPGEIVRLAVIGAVYVAAGHLGLALAFFNESASAVWPATGLALAAVLLYGARVAPAILVGAFLVNFTTSGSIAASVGIAVGNTAEAVVGALLVRRYAGGVHAFERVEDIFRFAALVALAATTLSATIGVLTLMATGLAAPGQAGTIWLTWWLGDTGGAMLVTPLLLLWARRPRPDMLRQRPYEGALLFATTIAVALFVFGGFTPFGRGHVPIAFMSISPLLWAAFRFSPRETAACNVLVAAIGIGGTMAGFGPYAAHGPGFGLLMLQAFIALAATTAIAAAAEASQRRQREADLRALNEDLEGRVTARTLDLQRAQERLAEAQQLAHVGSWEWDIAANAIWWSDELFRIFDVDPTRFDPSYDGYLQNIHPDDVATVDAAVREALRSRRPFAVEHRVARADGDVRFVAGHGDVVVDERGQPVRMRGTAQDITDRRRAEQAQAALTREQVARAEAEEANRLKDQFLATLSHELRTPLHAVIGWAQMLLDGALDSERHQRALQLIHRNAMLQNQLISDLLDVSRVTSGTLTIERVPVDLPAIIEAAVEAIRPAAVEKKITLVCTVTEQGRVTGDARRLTQVANNLLANAIKFTQPGGGVVVCLRREGGDFELRVEDTGPGIAPDFLPHAFDRFRQEDASVTREHGGLGLGLAIVRHIVELHGGRVSASNRTDTNGAVFVVSVPALIEAPAARQEASPPAARIQPS